MSHEQRSEPRDPSFGELWPRLQGARRACPRHQPYRSRVHDHLGAQRRRSGAHLPVFPPDAPRPAPAPRATEPRGAARRRGVAAGHARRQPGSRIPEIHDPLAHHVGRSDGRAGSRDRPERGARHRRRQGVRGRPPPRHARSVARAHRVRRRRHRRDREPLVLRRTVRQPRDGVHRLLRHDRRQARGSPRVAALLLQGVRARTAGGASRLRAHRRDAGAPGRRGPPQAPDLAHRAHSPRGHPPRLPAGRGARRALERRRIVSRGAFRSCAPGARGPGSAGPGPGRARRSIRRCRGPRSSCSCRAPGP
jgi:hypothetical protein